MPNPGTVTALPAARPQRLCTLHGGHLVTLEELTDVSDLLRLLQARAMGGAAGGSWVCMGSPHATCPAIPNPCFSSDTALCLASHPPQLTWPLVCSRPTSASASCRWERICGLGYTRPRRLNTGEEEVQGAGYQRGARLGRWSSVTRMHRAGDRRDRDPKLACLRVLELCRWVDGTPLRYPVALADTWNYGARCNQGKRGRLALAAGRALTALQETHAASGRPSPPACAAPPNCGFLSLTMTVTNGRQNVTGTVIAGAP